MPRTDRATLIPSDPRLPAALGHTRAGIQEPAGTLAPAGTVEPDVSARRALPSGRIACAADNGPHRPLLQATLAGLATAALLVAALAAASPVAAAPPVQVPPGDLLATYELVDTYEDEPWQLRAGHVHVAGDVVSGPDGRLRVLDGRSGFSAVHTISTEGAPEAVAELGLDTNWDNIDLGPDGTIYATDCTYVGRNIGQDETRCRIANFNVAGHEISGFDYLVADRLVRDLAVGSDGRIYLAVDDIRSGTTYESSAVHILDSEGHLLSVIEAADFIEVDHSVQPHYHVGFTALDVDGAGRMFVAFKDRECY